MVVSSCKTHLQSIRHTFTLILQVHIHFIYRANITVFEAILVTE